MTDKMTAEQALDVLAENMRDKDAGVIRLGIRDNDKTREAIAWLLGNRAALSAPRVPDGWEIEHYGCGEFAGIRIFGHGRSTVVERAKSETICMFLDDMLAASPEPVSDSEGDQK